MHNKNEIPISVETFAAYIDGMLSREEMERIGKIIESNDVLRAMVDTSDSIDEDIVFGSGISDIPKMEGIGIPDPLTDSFDELDINDNAFLDENVESFLKEEGIFFYDESERVPSEEDYISIGNLKCDSDMNAKETFGYEPNYDLNPFDPEIYQGYSNTCAIRAQEIVLRDYGIMIPQDDLVEYAENHGWFHDGTSKEHMGKLLDACGVATTVFEHASMKDLLNELGAGHRIIVGLDADELWLKKNPSLAGRLFGGTVNRISDGLNSFLGLEGANHALIVAGIRVNPLDPSDVHVILTDPGTGEVCIEYPYKEFEEAWADSNHYMVSTNEPAPFQYNYETHQMEPSGFSSDFFPADVVLPEGLENHFTLTDTFYDEFGSFSNTYSEESPFMFDHISEDRYADAANGAMLDESEQLSDQTYFSQNGDQSLYPHLNDISSLGETGTASINEDSVFAADKDAEKDDDDDTDDTDQGADSGSDFDNDDI